MRHIIIVKHFLKSFKKVLITLLIFYFIEITKLISSSILKLNLFIILVFIYVAV